MKLNGIIYFILFLALSSKAAPLIIGVTQEWSGFNPVTINLASTSSFSSFLVRSLTVRTATGLVVPDLAERVPTIADGSVKMTKVGQGTRKLIVKWIIKATAKWSDGHPVTCEDLKFGWEVGVSENVTVEQRSIYTNISSINWKPSKNQECSVEYKNLDWTFDRDVPAVLPSHLERPIFEKYKKQSLGYEQNSLYQKDPTAAGLYNGPFVIKEFKIGSHIILSPNRYFHGNQPLLKDVVIKYISDSATLKANLKTGSITSINAVGFPPDLALSLSKEFEADTASSYKVEFIDSPIFQGVFFNLENEILQDPIVRRALAGAINKKELTDAFFDSKLSAAETFAGPMNPNFKEPTSKYSPKGSIDILKSNGWKMGSDGFFSKNGRTLSLVVRTSSGIKVLEMIEIFICKEFSQIGVQCLVKNQPPRVLLGDTVPRGDFDLAIFGQPVVPDSSLRGIFHSSEIPNQKNAFAGGNITRVKDEKLDFLLSQFDGEWDQTKRKKIFSQIEKIVLEKNIFIPLYHRREAFVLPKKLKGMQTDISGTNYLFPEYLTLEP